MLSIFSAYSQWNSVVDAESVPLFEVKISQREKVAVRERGGDSVKLGFETNVKTA